MGRNPDDEPQANPLRLSGPHVPLTFRSRSSVAEPIVLCRATGCDDPSLVTVRVTGLLLRQEVSAIAQGRGTLYNVEGQAQ